MEFVKLDNKPSIFAKIFNRSVFGGVLVVSILFVTSCAKIKQTSYGRFVDIPLLKDNFVSGSYQITDHYPQAIVLGAYCEKNAGRYFAGWTECYEMKQEYQNIHYQEPYDSSIMRPKNMKQ